MPPPTETPEKGDKVSWNWGGSDPSGVVAEKKTDGKVSVTSKRGNTITKSAEPSDPAIAIERSGNDVVKKTSEVEVEEKGKGKKAAARPKTPKKKAVEEDKSGEKAAEKASEKASDKPAETPKKGTKRQAEDPPAEQPSAKRGRGRPKGSGLGVPRGKGKGLKPEKPTRVSTREKKEPTNLVNEVEVKKPRKPRTKKAAAPTVPKAKAAKSATGKKRGRPAGTGTKANVDKKPKAKALGPDGKPRGRGRPPKAK